MTIRFLRSLDGIFYAMLVFAGLTLYETFGVVTVRETPTVFTVLPLAGLLIATIYLPGSGLDDRRSIPVAIRLKMLALGLVGFYPFVSWQAQGVRNVYLTAGAGVALVLGTLYVLELLRLVDLIFGAARKTDLRPVCRYLRLAVYYFVLVPIITIYSFVLFHMTHQNAAAGRLLAYAWNSLGMPLRIVVTLFIMVCSSLMIFLLWQSCNCVKAVVKNTEICVA